MDQAPDFREQHQRRLSWMPWLDASPKPKHLAWAQPWQAEVQARVVGDRRDRKTS